MRGSALLQVLVNRDRGLAARAHGQDYRRRPGHDVTAGEHTIAARGTRLLVGDDAPVAVDFEAVGRPRNERVRVRAEGDDDDVGLHRELRVRHGNGAPAARFVGLAKLRADALDAAHPSVLVAEEALRHGEPVEDHALVARPLVVLRPRALLHLGAAVHDVRLLRAKADRTAHGVHRGVAGADDGRPPRPPDRRVVFGERVRVHQVDARQELVGRVDALEVFAGDIHEDRRARAGADEDCRVAKLVDELVDGDRLADNHVPHELHAERLEVLDVLIDDLLRQTVLRYPVAEDATERVQRLEDRHRVAELREVAGRREAGRAGADDRDLLVTPDLARGGFAPAAVRALPVGDETLKPADADRILMGGKHATRLALVLDRADAAADRGQQVTATDRGGGAREIPERDVAHEVADRHVDRTTLLAHGVLAGQAAARLGYGALHGIALGDLVPAPAALLRVQARHRGLARIHDGHGAYLPSPASLQASFSCSS